jgi:hypothetical protein
MKKQTGIGRRNLVDIKMGESREEMERIEQSDKYKHNKLQK